MTIHLSGKGTKSIIGKGGFMTVLKESFKENDGLKVRMVSDKYGDEMVISRTEGNWNGFPVNKQVAELMIESLKEFYSIK